MDREERTVSMKKRLVSLMLAGLLTLSLTACGGQKSDSPATSGNGDAAPSGTIVLKCGHVLADGSHFDFGVDKFAELVNEKSGGTLQVEVHTDGTLGQEREMMESLQIGNLDLALVSTAPISNFYSQMSVLDMPYLFDSKAHAYAVLDGEIGQSLFDGLESQGMVGLTYMENGFRNVFSTKPITKPADLKGVKIRIMENQIQTATFSALNAIVTNMASGEVYTGLQQGTIDAQENPYEVIVSNKLYEQQDYVVETNHLPHLISLIVSDEFFEGLTGEQQEIICQPKAYLNELMSDDSHEQAPGNDDFDTTPYTVLVVDDNPDLTDFLKKSLGEYFKRVVIASNGAEALQLIRSHTPDIIVSDVMMPRMNGYELCKSIKEDITISHIPIILLTARDDQQSQLSGYKNGADAYLTKPFEIEMLMEIICNRLKNRESTKKRYLNAGVIPAPEESTFSQADETFLLKLNKIIQENLDNSSLDIAFICKEIGMSRASLYNKLKALTDMGANDYINKFRMEKAIAYITETDMTFTEIAEKVGFTTSRYFSTAFKQYTGETPTQYKEKRKK